MFIAKLISLSTYLRSIFLEAWLGPPQISKMESFALEFKLFILDVWGSPGHAYDCSITGKAWTTHLIFFYIYFVIFSDKKYKKADLVQE